MAVKTYSFRYRPTTAPSGTEDRVLACSHTTDACHCVINSSGQIGYYVSGSFTQLGTKTQSIDNIWHSYIVEKDELGNGCIYVDGQKIGCATNFPIDNVNQIGNFKTELKPEVGRKPKVGLKPRGVSNIYTRPCCGDIDEIAYFDRQLSASEIVDLAQSGSLSKVYTLADYKITAMADDNIIATTEKPRYSENWRSIWDANQRTTALPTAIGSITVNGSYKALATAANDAGIWTPTTTGTPAYNYYQAVENWRQMYFVSSGGGTGFLLTAQLGVDTDISAMSPTFEARQSALMFAEDALRSAVMIKRQSTAELTAVANANAYTDELEDALRSQTDHAIVFTTSASDPSTGWTAEEKLIHKGDYWRVDASSAWKTWTGTTWGTVNDAQAQAAATVAAGAASTAQTTADKKTTLWATLSVANSDGAVAGDMFMDSSLIYRCLTSAPAITVANSTRITSKNFGNLASAPTGAIANDRYYNTTTLTWYRYTGSAWTADGEALNTVTVTYTPKYLGRYLGTHPASYNNGDWWLVYDTDDSPIVRGFWYSNNGTPARVSLLSAEAQRKYKGVGLEDVLYASNNGYALLSGVYDPVAVYGVSVMEFLAVNQAFINKLVTQQLQFQEYVASIAGNTLVPRSGSTPGTQQIYMGKNPRYPNDVTRAYEFALQEYLGMDGTKEVWMKHFWTRILASGVAALTLAGCVQANDGVLSQPGVVWKELADPFGTSALFGIAYGNGKWVAVGQDGKIAYSTDGQTFTLGTSPFGTSFVYGVAYDNGKWVAVGSNGKIAYSTNGQTFTLGTSPFGTSYVNGIAYGNGKWVAVGQDGKIAYSTDGQTFTLGSSPFGTSTVHGIAYGNGKWVAGGISGKIAYSTDGQTFTLGTSPFGTSYVNGIAYGNGKWVAVGDSGKIAYSTDGQTFTLGTSPFGTSTVYGIAYGNGKWVVVGTAGKIAYSTDGQTFASENMSQPFGINGFFNNVACDDNGTFIAVGYLFDGSGSIIIRSDPLEAGGGVVGKVYDTARGELNKLWDGRYFPSYASVNEIAPKKYFRFPAGTTKATVFTALSPYLAVGSNTACMGMWNGLEILRIHRSTATQIIFANNSNNYISNLYINQGDSDTLVAALQVEFIIYQA